MNRSFLNEAAIRAKANMLQSSFENCFNLYEKSFRIYKYKLKECFEFHRLFFSKNSEQAEKIYDELKPLFDLYHYYVNFNENEFRYIIELLRNFYYHCSIYIDLEVVERIIDREYSKT